MKPIAILLIAGGTLATLALLSGESKPPPPPPPPPNPYPPFPPLPFPPAPDDGTPGGRAKVGDLVLTGISAMFPTGTVPPSFDLPGVGTVSSSATIFVRVDGVQGTALSGTAQSLSRSGGTVPEENFPTPIPGIVFPRSAVTGILYAS